MSVYVDEFPGTGWGKWQGGGHLQADTEEELHAFAASLGLKRQWFQKGGRPETDHYDLTASKRALAIKLGAIDEDVRAGAARRAKGMGLL